MPQMVHSEEDEVQLEEVVVVVTRVGDKRKWRFPSLILTLNLPTPSLTRKT